MSVKGARNFPRLRVWKKSFVFRAERSYLYLTFMSSNFEIIGEEWRLRAHEMAEWAWNRMVNRKDVWGQYTSPPRGSKKSYAALTLPQKKMRGQDMVSLDKLERHFGSLKRHHLIGLHSQSSDHTCKWFAIDIDLHDCDDRIREDVARRNYAAATGWWEVLQLKGYDPLLLDSNGRGGFHLLVLFAEPAPLTDVYHFAEELTADWEKRNLDNPPETFPKSDKVNDEKLGAWLRLPGMHHTHDHFTRVWCGDEWLDDPWLSGDAAIDAILGTTPGPAPKSVSKKKRVAKKPVAPAKKKIKSVCVDLDGVLSTYSGWKGSEHFGEPIDGAVDFTRELARKYRVIIFTSRTHEPDCEDVSAAVKGVGAWLDRHGFAYDEIYTGTGKPFASAYVDDRGVSCRPQDDGQKAFEVAAIQIEKLARG